MTQTMARAAAMLGVLALTAPSHAQQPPPSTTPIRGANTRPATTSASGDTGLWFVPTAEILPAKQWSISAYRVNFDYEQGFTDVSNWPVTFAFGLKDRVELFAAVTAVNRIDRDARPLFGTADSGGAVNEYPFVRDGWTGSNFGDLWIGAKINLASQRRQQPAAFAVRALVKIPTASDDDGAGTGRPDFALDGIVSAEVNERIELTAFGGYIVRSDPELFDLVNGIRWGAGAAMPTRKSLRLTAEVHGEQYLDDTVTFRGVQPAVIGALPIVSDAKGPVNASMGLTWLAKNGLFAGAGINWNLRISGRSDFGAEDETGDALGFQFRVGYHPGVARSVPPAKPMEAPPPAPANRPPSVRARCEPCTVDAGKSATLTAQAMDPDGDTLTYRWSAAAGSLSDRGSASVPWTAPPQEGTVIATVEVEDGRGGRATDAVTISVRPLAATVNRGSH